VDADDISFALLLPARIMLISLMTSAQLALLALSLLAYSTDPDTAMCAVFSKPNPQHCFAQTLHLIGNVIA
jgi:hypothetical protein